MAEKQDLLIEIGTEELPPKALKELAQAFRTSINAGLASYGLVYEGLHGYATPRRIAVIVNDLITVQPDQSIERRGPSIKAAFRNGLPTAAADGFAKSCGISTAALEILETEKGSWVVHRAIVPGINTKQLIPNIVQTALKELPIPKRMRWADLDEEFVRPVHWLILLLGTEVIPGTILGVPSDRVSYGHRFHHPHPIHIPDPKAYADLLNRVGKVIVDFDQRRSIILSQIKQLAASVRKQPLIDDVLLEEVTALVEWPMAVLGAFDKRFLDVPAEALISTMQGNQKYFPIISSDGLLAPYFITIANIESIDIEQIRSGNERVIRPRFADAEFFWQQDRKRTLYSRLDTLKSVVFQHKLGSLYEKCERNSKLVAFIANHIGLNTDWCMRAGWLCKTDLVTDMVQEFPDLQGTMGRYYAQHDGEPSEVAIALEEYYKPRFAGDSLPSNTIGLALSIADRLDTLVGIFSIGLIPTGAKDPFALRRASLGVIRLIIEGQIDIDLEDCLERAAKNYGSTIKAESSIQPVFAFILERLRMYYSDKGIQSDVIEAVLECRPTHLLDFDRRLRAITHFRLRPDAASLSAANKRIWNILKKVDGTLPFNVDPSLLHDEAEQFLAGRLAELSSEVIPLLEQSYYEDALERLAELKDPVDHFFDQVLVMDEQENVRHNRIALLNEVRSLFLRVADFSRLQA